MSNNFIIRSGRINYFLKRYRSGDKKFINKIINVELFFHNGGIPVILPFKTAKNDFLFYYKRYFYSLFPFVDCKNLKKEYLQKKHLKSAAEILASMHLLSSKGSPKIIGKFIKKYEKDRFLLHARKMLQVIRKKKSKTKFDNLAEKDIILKTSLAVKNKKSLKIFPCHPIILFMEIIRRQTYFLTITVKFLMCTILNRQ